MESLHTYWNSHLAIVVFLILGIILPIVALTAGRILRPNQPSSQKSTTYESGIEPFQDARYLTWKPSFSIHGQLRMTN